MMNKNNREINVKLSLIQNENNHLNQKIDHLQNTIDRMTKVLSYSKRNSIRQSTSSE